MSAHLPPSPQPPDWSFDWEGLSARYSWLRDLRGCPQDPVRHAEGDVATHVRMVCTALVGLPAWQQLDSTDQQTLFTAALLHDVAKPACTRVEHDGKISSRGHSWRGAIMARRILWRMGTPFAQREQIAALVRHHLVPLYLWERDDPGRLAIEVSQTARCDLLALLAEADARGRICPEPQKLLDNIALFQRCCAEQGCLTTPYPFPDGATRFRYFSPPPRPSEPGLAEGPCAVILLSGLPGAGKDHWISQQAPRWPIVGIDTIRQELGISPTEPQGPVLNHARELARGYLRRRDSFIWNATNLSRQIRAECVRLFTDYRATVRMVYLEVPPERLFAQNRQRRLRVPQPVIERLLDRWEVPDATEAHHVEWQVET